MLDPCVTEMTGSALAAQLQQNVIILLVYTLPSLGVCMIIPVCFQRFASRVRALLQHAQQFTRLCFSLASWALSAHARHSSKGCACVNAAPTLVLHESHNRIKDVGHVRYMALTCAVAGCRPLARRMPS